MYGGNDFKCRNCKVSFKEHSVLGNRGLKAPVKRGAKTITCDAFASTWSDTCGEHYGSHKTVFEKMSDRIRDGRAVSTLDAMSMQGVNNDYQIAADRMEGMYAEMGRNLPLQVNHS